MDEKTENKLANLYNKTYKLLLLIPIAVLILSLAYIGYFYSLNKDFVKKDISLTGGTSITIFSQKEISVSEISDFLSDKIKDFTIRELSDFRSGKQKAIVIETTKEISQVKPLLENFLKYKLTNENSTIESTGSSLGQGFYKQLIYSIILSFSFMAIVVFFIFGGNWIVKISAITLTIAPVILFFQGLISINHAIIISSIVLLINIPFYFMYSVPSAAVIISAFADIIMTLALINLLGMKISSAGIIAFLMLIGYSVDTDIMLTTRLLKRREQTNKKLFNAFKTGITMTLTSIAAIITALIITQSFSEVLKQIFTILLIGLFFDIPNTWITNASILKLYLERKNKK